MLIGNVTVHGFSLNFSWLVMNPEIATLIRIHQYTNRTSWATKTTKTHPVVRTSFRWHLVCWKSFPLPPYICDPLLDLRFLTESPPKEIKLPRAFHDPRNKRCSVNSRYKTLPKVTNGHYLNFYCIFIGCRISKKMVMVFSFTMTVYSRYIDWHLIMFGYSRPCRWQRSQKYCVRRILIKFVCDFVASLQSWRKTAEGSSFCNYKIRYRRRRWTVRCLSCVHRSETT